MIARISRSMTIGGRSRPSSDSAISDALPMRENTAPK
jgi:hypothetical protein